MAKQITDNTFKIVFNRFFEGFAPVAHLNSLTELGGSGQAASMSNIDILSPDYLTQGPALANLTNGTQAGAVTELINYIMDKAVSNDLTFGIGPTKLFKLSSTAVTSDGTFPHTITNSTDGSSAINLNGVLYYFYNKASGGDIGKYDLASTFDDDWGSTVPTGSAALQKAIHPVATKEDIMAFGNGQYLGTYITTTDTLAVSKLDFKAGNVVADVAFHANQWQIAVNSGVTGTNRNTSQVYQYDGSAVSTILADETALGVQRIGFIYPMNGIIYLAFQDLSTTGGFKIGYISGRQIKVLRSFVGDLPTFAQKTLYKDTILFLSSGLIGSCGASVDSLPIQISQHADGGYATCGALAAPFGTPMVASTDGGSNFRLAKFSGFDVNCSWRSITIPLIDGRRVGYIDDVIVMTKVLGAGARCDLVVETNQGVTAGTVQQIKTTGKTRHTFNRFGLPGKGAEDFRLYLNWANGSASNDCAIRQIQVLGHFVETK